MDLAIEGRVSRRRGSLVAVVIGCVLGAMLTVGAGPASASVGLTPIPSFTSPTVPGQTAPAQLTIANNSSGAEATVSTTVTDITLIPSCGTTTPGCPAPDPGVFQLSGPFVGTASAGAVCPTSYTAALINATTGEIRFTPSAGAPNPVLDVGEFCRISFTTTTLRVPTVDAQPATPGVQTGAIGSATGTAQNGAIGGGFGATFATVNRAPAGLATQATPQQADVGEGFADLATVSGPTGAPVPTGTVTFQLFGPTSPGFPLCDGAPFTTTSAKPLTPTGPTSATAGSGTVGVLPAAPVGNYVFVASYSGDANYTPSVGACSDAAERVTVNPLPAITVENAATPPSRPEPGGMFTFNIVVTNNSAEGVTITSLTDDVYGNVGLRGTCVTAVGTVLSGGGTYSCAYDAPFNGPGGASQTSTTTATAVDSDNNIATDGDEATVSITNVLPTATLSNTPTPTSRPAPGGVFTFNVVVTNTSPEPVTITSLTDDVYGNVATQGTCTTAVGTVLAANGGTYSCSFTGSFNGAAGASQTSTVTVKVVDDEGSEASPSDGATVSILGADYVPLSPTRIVDTRPGTVEGDGLNSALGPDSVTTIPVASMLGVDPASVDVVVLNITVTQPTQPGHITVWPTGEPRPVASSLNFLPSQNVPNLVVAKLGSGGNISLHNPFGTIHVVIDAQGYFPTSNPFVGLSPSRILDSRPGGVARNGSLGAGESFDLQVTGRGGVPASGVDSVVLNLTVTEPTASSFMTAWPAGHTRPLASNINFRPGQTTANSVIVKVGDLGKISLYNHSGSTHVIADVQGYFPTGGDYTSVVPNRLLDTRSSTAIGPGETRTITAPTGANAVVLNVTATQPTTSGFLTVWPTGVARPTASNLNFVAGQTVANLVISKVGPDGTVSVFNSSGDTHVVVDLEGYFTSSP